MSDELPSQGSRLFWGLFWSTLLVLAMLYLYLQQTVSRQSGQLSVAPDGQVTISHQLAEQMELELPAVFASSREDLARIGDDLRQLIDQRLVQAFQPVRASIPQFLDFHYSLTGEYTELLAALNSDSGGELRRILFVESGFQQGFDSALGDIAQQADDALGDLLLRLHQRLKSQLGLDDLDMQQLDKVVTLSIEDATSRFGSGELVLKGGGALASGAAVAAVVAKSLGTKAATKAAAKMAGKTALKATGVGSGAAGGAAAGLLCGPAAWICAPVAGVAAAVAAWFATDKVVIEVDEFLNREEFAEELVTALAQEREALAAQIYSAHQRRLQSLLEHNQRQLEDLTTRELIERGGGPR